MTWTRLTTAFWAALILSVFISCSTKDDDNPVRIELNPEYGIFPFDDTAKVNLTFELFTNKKLYSPGNTVKIFFRIFLPRVDDADTYYKFEFSSNEKLGIEIFSDEILVYHHPKVIVSTRDSLIVTGGIPVILQHNWMQVDDSFNHVSFGEYTIRASLLDNNSEVTELKIKITSN